MYNINVRIKNKRKHVVSSHPILLIKSLPLLSFFGFCLVYKLETEHKKKGKKKMGLLAQNSTHHNNPR